PRLSDETTGDPALADALREAAGDRGYRGLAVALVEGGTVRTAGLGSTGGPDARPIHEHTPFEIGSIGKGLTGMLLADSGLDPATPLAALLPDVRFDDVDLANASLEELTSHRSGLPRLRITITSFARSWLAGVLGTDPYRGDTAQSVLDDVAAASSSGPSGMSYSNLGVAVLGLALAEEAGQPYPDLLDERILQPLGMTDTMFASHEEGLPEGRAHGVRANGLPADPWLERGWGGAGLGLWSTLSDLARLMSALIDGSAPGADATTPRF